MTWRGRFYAPSSGLSRRMGLAAGGFGAAASGLASAIYLRNSAEMGWNFCSAPHASVLECTGYLVDIRYSELLFVAGLAIIASAYLLVRQRKRQALSQ